MHFLRSEDRVYWPYLFSAAAISFFLYLSTQQKTSLLGYLKYLFPRDIWLHKSSRLDTVYFLVNRILFLLVFTPFVLTIFPVVNALWQDALASSLAHQPLTAPFWVKVIYAASIVLVLDFLRFFTHYLSHRVPVLWEFHKLHHSAEVMTPITVYRMHPIDDLLALITGSVALAVMHGFMSTVFADDFTFWTFGVTSLTAMFFYTCGYNLRHSHIPLRYPASLSKWLISPAQHQVHHSCTADHIDKNFGFMFAFWDRMFGTLHVPARGEALKLGLAEPAKFESVFDCYVTPFRKLFGRSRRGLFVTLALLGGITGSAAIAVSNSATTELRLAELTTTEVSELINSHNVRRVIIPTAGVEQNGEHLVLGKHNHVVSYAAQQLAARLGKTLVAPTVDFVPEGDHFPPTGHMPYAGTISVRESTFHALLEDIAASLVQHGFQRIYYLGDSGGNQEIQAAVARQLNQRYGAEGVIVASINDYYDNNGQMAYLQTLGYSREQVGGHAGIRDASELLFVNPAGVRMVELRESGQTPEVGISGAYWHASRSMGEAMLELKLEAAVKQIEALENQPSPLLSASPANTR